MALPFAHVTAGYVAYEAVRPAGPHRPLLLAAGVALANGPDADFLPGLFVDHPAAWHRGPTHTIVAVAVVAMLVVLGMRLRSRSAVVAARAASWAAATWASHLAIDWATIDAVGHGTRFLWPFSAARYTAPVPLLDEIVIDPSGRAAFFASLVTRHGIAVWTHELTFLLGTVVAVHAARAVLARAAAPIEGVPEES